MYTDKAVAELQDYIEKAIKEENLFLMLDCLGNVGYYRGVLKEDSSKMRLDDFIQYVRNFQMGDPVYFCPIYSLKDLDRAKDEFVIEPWF